MAINGGRQWIQWAALGALLVMLLGLLSLSAFVKEDEEKELNIYPSTANGGPLGAKGFREILNAAHIPYALYKKSFKTLEEKGVFNRPVTMVVLGPKEHDEMGQHRYFTPQDSKRLLQWVARGNTLVILDDFQIPGAKHLAQSLGIKIQRASGHKTRVDATKTMELFRKDLSPKVREAFSKDLMAKSDFMPGPALKESYKTNFAENTIADYVEYAIQPNSVQPHQIMLKTKQGLPIWVKVPRGKGKVILGSTPYFVANDLLYDRPAVENFKFLAQLLVAEGRPILINEYCQGLSDRPDNFIAYLYQTPMGRILDQTLILMMLIFWIGLSPLRPLRMEYLQKGGIDMRSFIRSMASIYYRTRSARLILGPSLTALDHHLQRRYRFGLKSTVGDAPESMEELRRLLQSTLQGYSNKEQLTQSVLLAKRAVERDETLSPTQWLKLSQDLSTVQEAFRHVRHQNP